MSGQPDELGVRILDVLGIDARDVRSVHLTVVAGEVPTLVVVRMVRDGGDLADLVDGYELRRSEFSSPRVDATTSALPAERPAGTNQSEAGR